VLLKQAGHDLGLVPIHNHPDEAGLLGSVHLAPAWMFAGHDAVIALDIGGSNVRAGIIDLPGKKKPDLDKCAVKEMQLWRYADETPQPTREHAVQRMCEMVSELKQWAKRHDRTLAPFVGVACPGLIAPDGHIERGGQNLPGNWESDRFNLPRRIREAIPRINDEETIVLMHNDAVVQGLSELPFVDDVDEWGVLTIGTGLGNAKFTNRRGA
jgi:predicted NBD/HSP70 family sugar kinase